MGSKHINIKQIVASENPRVQAIAGTLALHMPRSGKVRIVVDMSGKQYINIYEYKF